MSTNRTAYELLIEYRMSNQHKQSIARARRGDRHSSNTKQKIAKSMEGKKNFEGKRHTSHAKNVIGAKRGQRDPIRGRHWIVNRSGKTYRRFQTPPGYKARRRVYESFKSYSQSEE